MGDVSVAAFCRVGIMNRRVRPPEGEVVFGIHAGRARVRRTLSHVGVKNLTPALVAARRKSSSRVAIGAPLRRASSR